MFVANLHDLAEQNRLNVSFALEWDDVYLVDSISQSLNLLFSSLTHFLQLIGELNSMRSTHAHGRKMAHSSGSQAPDLVKWYQVPPITKAS